MNKWAIMLSTIVLLGGCNTYHALEGKTSKERMVGGVRQDAKVTGDTIERGAHEIGDAISKTLK
jgi:hypothetical protein